MLGSQPVAAAAPKVCEDHDFNIYYGSNDIKKLIRSRQFEKKVRYEKPGTFVGSGFVYKGSVVVETRFRTMKSLGACKTLLRTCDYKNDRRKPNWHMYCIEIRKDKSIGRLFVIK